MGEWHPSFLSLGLQEAAPFLGSKDLPDRPHSLAEVSQSVNPATSTFTYPPHCPCCPVSHPPSPSLLYPPSRSPRPLQAPSTDPYKAPPAPLVRPGTTGLARSSSSSSSSSKDGEEEHGPSFGGGDGDGPFSDAFLNNVPAQDVPKDEDDCIALGRDHMT